MERQELEQMNEMARGHLRHVESIQRRKELEEEASQPVRRAPIKSTGVRYNDEGVETHPVQAEGIDVPTQLPSKEASFSVRSAQYRLEIRLQRPGAVTVERQGKTIVQSRRMFRRSVLDIQGGQFTVSASSAILDLRLHRFESRSKGTIVLGPFEAEGVVEARAIGHGSWSAEVASNRVYDADLDESGQLPSLQLQGSVWEGEPRGQSLPENKLDPIEGGWPWSVVRRFESGLKEPTWASAVKAGTTTSGHEKITEDGVIELDHFNFQYWRGVEKWTLLAGTNAPSFDPVPGRWTYVWGTATGADHAYSLKTGRQTDPTSRGVYLAKSDDPESVEISGAYGSKGNSVPADRATLGPGSRWKASKSHHPPQVLVRLEGSGLARAVEIQTTRKKGPKGMEVTSSRRIDLSKLWSPRRKNVPSPQRPEGQGIFLPHTERSPSE